MPQGVAGDVLAYITLPEGCPANRRAGCLRKLSALFVWNHSLKPLTQNLRYSDSCFNLVCFKIVISSHFSNDMTFRRILAFYSSRKWGHFGVVHVRSVAILVGWQDWSQSF